MGVILDYSRWISAMRTIKFEIVTNATKSVMLRLHAIWALLQKLQGGASPWRRHWFFVAHTAREYCIDPQNTHIHAHTIQPSAAYRENAWISIFAITFPFSHIYSITGWERERKSVRKATLHLIKVITYPAYKQLLVLYHPLPPKTSPQCPFRSSRMRYEGKMRGKEREREKICGSPLGATPSPTPSGKKTCMCHFQGEKRAKFWYLPLNTRVHTL